MRKVLITITTTVEACLPNDLTATEFTKRFPYNLTQHDAVVVDTLFESEEFLERIDQSPS